MSDNKKVLALDDQKSMQNILTFALKKDFDLTVVAKAQDAIDKARTESFDFVLLDITLDGDSIDGIGVALEIQDAGIATPLAFLTSLTPDTLSNDQKDRVAKLKNIKFYQSKPIAPLDLIGKIREALD
ncbi:MAG: response regulator [Proteobacteria bacterium]|nr:response regulator [Pseudomonadota bacterium]